MSDMLDIARSGLMAARTALAVTSDNVANVDTEGYRRRDVATVAAVGSQATALTAATGGQGVSVVDVRRAFDGLLAARARSTSGAAAAAEAHLNGVEAVETLMIPGEDGLDGTLRDFFDSLATLAANPTASANRALALAAAGATAGAISGLAEGLDGLRAGLVEEAEAAAGQAQGILEDLASLSRSMAGLGGGAALNGLADRRDALLDDLADILPIAVSLDSDGRPTVRLGSAAGPLLLLPERAARLEIAGGGDLTLAYVAADGTRGETRALTSGRLGGLADSLGALDMTIAELDAYARGFVAALNTVHRGGVDLAGVPGGDLFRLDGWQAQPAAATGGTVRVVLTATQAAAPMEMLLTRDAAAGLWRATDTAGMEIASGADRLVLPGVTVDLAGSPRDGDRIRLIPSVGHARDLALAVTDPARLAAASAYVTTSAAANRGTASLAIGLAEVPESGLVPLSDQLAGGPVALLGGVVGVVPAGTQSLSLASLGEVASTTLPWQAGAAGLVVTLGGVTRTFDVSGLGEAGAAVTALGAGLRAQDGMTLAQLGLVAAVDAAGALVLHRPGEVQPVAASLDGVAGQEVPGSPAGGIIQIITREGRHVAGTPLSPEAVASLITEANGFLPGAVYDASPLQAGTGAIAYRGLSLTRADVPGLQGLTLPAPAPVLGVGALPVAPPRALILGDAAGGAVQLDLPVGASAALLAGRLDAALPGLGARAVTGLQLSGLPPGPISLALTGANVAPLEVASVIGSGGGASALAQAINALSGTTGIRAELSPQGDRLLLVQGDGHDIGLSALTLAGGSLTATAAGPDGVTQGVGVALSGGMALRQGGQVMLAAAQGFTLGEGGVVLASQPGVGDLVRAATSAAGAVVRLEFDAVPELAEGGLRWRGGYGAEVAVAALPAGSPAAAVAGSLAASLRAVAPDAVLTGAPLASLPADGTTMGLTVEGVAYSLRMQGGVPLVHGPEAGRVTAGFDGQNRLVISAKGVTGGGGIGFAATPALGLGLGQASLELRGQPLDAAGLPTVLSVEVAGLVFDLTVATGSVTVPPGFPGSAGIDAATGRLGLTLAAPASGLRIGTAGSAGFGGQEVAVRVEADALVLAGRDGALDLRSSVAGAMGQALRLSDLPPEDLVVAVTGSGTLRLAGGVVAGSTPTGPGAVRVELLDAGTGRIALADAVTGHRIAEAALDGFGRARLGGLAVQLAGTGATGDAFRLAPSGAGSADAGVARALAALRGTDGATGSTGLVDGFTRLQAQAGVRVTAAERKLASTTAAADAAGTALAAIGAVDLDAEAARLLELQQSYQASAQAIGIARQLFDTLLNIF